MQVLQKVGAHSDAVWALGWNSQGLITGSVDESAKLYQITTSDGKMSMNQPSDKILKNLMLGVVSIAVNPENSLVALSSMDSCIRLWDVSSNAVVKIIDCGALDAWSVAFSPNGRFICSGSHNGMIGIWDVQTQKRVISTFTKETFVLCTTWSPDGKRIACGLRDGSVFILDVSMSSSDEEGEDNGDTILSLVVSNSLLPHSLPVRSVCFSPDSKILYSGADDAQVNIYNVEHSNSIGTLRGHVGWILCVQVSPNGRIVATSSADKTVKLWDVSPEAIATSSGAASESSQAHRQQLGFGKCMHSFEKCHTDQIFSLAFSPNGTKLVSGGGEGAIQFYSIP